MKDGSQPPSTTSNTPDPVRTLKRMSYLSDSGECIDIVRETCYRLVSEKPSLAFSFSSTSSPLIYSSAHVLARQETSTPPFSSLSLSRALASETADLGVGLVRGAGFDWTFTNESEERRRRLPSNQRRPSGEEIRLISINEPMVAEKERARASERARRGVRAWGERFSFISI